MDNIVGRKSGRLTAISTFKNTNGKISYLCNCECGKQIAVQPSLFKKEKIKSCGCNKNTRFLGNGVATHNRVLGRYKQNAEKRGLEFNLTLEQFKELIHQDCYYCGAAPSNVWKSDSKDNSLLYNGIDRKDNKIGYVIDNCVSSCKACNFLKGSLSSEAFLNLVFKITFHRGLKSEMPQMGDLVEKLSISNMKLFEVCNQKTNPNLSKEEVDRLLKKDIELCRERAMLKSEINRLFYGRKAIEEVKNYGGSNAGA